MTIVAKSQISTDISEQIYSTIILFLPLFPVLQAINAVVQPENHYCTKRNFIPGKSNCV